MKTNSKYYIDGSGDYSQFTVADLRKVAAAMEGLDPDTPVHIRTDWEGAGEHEQPTKALVEHSEHGIEDGEGILWIDFTVNE